MRTKNGTYIPVRIRVNGRELDVDCVTDEGVPGFWVDDGSSAVITFDSEDIWSITESVTVKALLKEV